MPAPLAGLSLEGHAVHACTCLYSRWRFLGPVLSPVRTKSSAQISGALETSRNRPLRKWSCLVFLENASTDSIGSQQNSKVSVDISNRIVIITVSTGRETAVSSSQYRAACNEAPSARVARIYGIIRSLNKSDIIILHTKWHIGNLLVPR